MCYETEKNRQNMFEINVKRYNQFEGDLIYALQKPRAYAYMHWVSHLLTR